MNGKIRTRLRVAPGIAEADALALALDDPNVKAHVEGKTIRKRIFVADKLLNLVAA